jgi:light-regulated signal transduction histidine kinase (bacteriophytochrome)
MTDSVLRADDSPPADLLGPNDPVDLTNCDREPIHIPGRIQPHGVLLALREPEMIITQASANAASLFDQENRTLPGLALTEVVGAEQFQRMKTALDSEEIQDGPIYLLTLRIGSRDFDVTAHRARGGVLVLEMELPEMPGGVVRGSLDYYGLVKKALPRLQKARTVVELAEAAAAQVRQISGFDRVMVYQFNADGHGSVLAEDRREDLDPFLGLHYPASDIPRQARHLYLLNPLRILADVEHAAADLIPMLNPDTGQPLDMSCCVLRSPSPIHIEYLKNMGVSATLTISLIENGQLWGLIACHHDSPRAVPYDVRTACEFLGQIVSLQLAGKQSGEDLQYRSRLQSAQTRLIEAMSRAERYQQGLTEETFSILDFVDAGGAAVCVDGECVRLGDAPPERFIRELTDWLADTVEEDVWMTDALPGLFPDATAHKDTASGLLVIAITRDPKNYLLWFRPEVVHTVNWAGDPNKPVTAAPDGSQRLSPRGSFALWKETVRLRSLPWKQAERDAAGDFRRALVEVVLRKAEEVARLNAVLARSNSELDSFAYIASHDLKEPLRGIHNYAHFLQEDYADRLDDEGREKLAILGRLTVRMDALIDTLLAYSRVGRLELNLEPCDLNLVLKDVLEDLQFRLAESGTEVRVPRVLPTVVCDRIQVSEIFSNLISNAAKYNDKLDKWVEIGYQEGSATVLYVRDNGIGIRERHFETVFRIFKRLHGRDEYSGGTGAGLTIARKIAERHGGRLWLESTPGEGTVFYFTLEQ